MILVDHLIRNELDVAHIAIAPPTQEQIDSVLKFMSRSKAQVRTFLEHDKVHSGRVTLAPIDIN